MRKPIECPYCNKQTKRIVRTLGHKIRVNQKNVFSEWDKCMDCGFIKHYERYRTSVIDWLDSMKQATNTSTDKDIL